MRKIVICLLFIGFCGTASATCIDYSGKYQRRDDKFTIQWMQHGCHSMTVTEFGFGTIDVKIDGKYRKVSPEPALKAFLFLNEKFIFSYISNDASNTMTIVYTKTENGGLRGEVSDCTELSCEKSVDLYDPI